MTSVHYSYVDPLGSLITVRYTAGPDGYVETRNVQEDFVSIRQAAAPVRPVVAQQPAVVVAQPSDSDLVKCFSSIAGINITGSILSKFSLSVMLRQNKLERLYLARF